MKIAVIGRGNIGRTLAEKWITAGHEVTFGVRDRATSARQRFPRQSPPRKWYCSRSQGQPRRISSSTSARRCRARSSSATNDVGSGKLGALDELAAGAGS